MNSDTFCNEPPRVGMDPSDPEFHAAKPKKPTCTDPEQRYCYEWDWAAMHHDACIPYMTSQSRCARPLVSNAETPPFVIASPASPACGSHRELNAGLSTVHPSHSLPVASSSPHRSIRGLATATCAPLARREKQRIKQSIPAAWVLPVRMHGMMETFGNSVPMVLGPRTAAEPLEIFFSSSARSVAHWRSDPTRSRASRLLCCCWP